MIGGLGCLGLGRSDQSLLMIEIILLDDDAQEHAGLAAVPQLVYTIKPYLN